MILVSTPLDNRRPLSGVTNIIIGNWPLDKFDEFMEKWHATGGEEVTQRVQDWYANVAGQ